LLSQQFREAPAYDRVVVHDQHLRWRSFAAEPAHILTFPSKRSFAEQSTRVFHEGNLFPCRLLPGRPGDTPVPRKAGSGAGNDGPISFPRGASPGSDSPCWRNDVGLLQTSLCLGNAFFYASLRRACHCTRQAGVSSTIPADVHGRVYGMSARGQIGRVRHLASVAALV